MPRQLRHVIVLALSAISLGPAIVRAQTLDDPQALLGAYAAIVAKYLDGRAEAATDLLALGSLRLKTIHDLMGRAARQPALLAQETWTTRLLRAAAMLHSDIAFDAYSKGDAPSFRQHAEAADRLLQVAERRETDNDFRPRWHVAAGHELLAWADVEAARVFLTRASRTPGGTPSTCA